MSIASDALENLELKILMEALKKIKYGSLKLTMPNKEEYLFQGNELGLDVNLHIKDTACVDAILKQGDIGLGETYMNDQWTTSDLPNLLTFFVQNMTAIESLIHGNRFFQFLWNISKFFNKNSKSGSKKNIIKHYDLGNDFYSLWLDHSMTYSSGIFPSSDTSIDTAQEKKYERILAKLPKETKNILEIGCGWGGFAEKAAQHGYHVTGITLSPSQEQYAKTRLEKKKLSSQTNIKICDYRDMKEQFDSIASIEMFEAVGQEYWETYFETLKRCLKPKGKAVIQTITIHEDVFEGYKKRVDFIQKHIFPGGVLPSKKIFKDLAIKFGFNVEESFEFGESYSQTLHQWLESFDAVTEELKKLGFQKIFIRKWRFYFAYCIAGFKTGQTDVVQFTLSRP